jgi:hypothetical protein
MGQGTGAVASKVHRLFCWSSFAVAPALLIHSNRCTVPPTPLRKWAALPTLAAACASAPSQGPLLWAWHGALRGLPRAVLACVLIESKPVAATTAATVAAILLLPVHRHALPAAACCLVPPAPRVLQRNRPRCNHSSPPSHQAFKRPDAAASSISTPPLIHHPTCKSHPGLPVSKEGKQVWMKEAGATRWLRARPLPLPGPAGEHLVVCVAAGVLHVPCSLPCNGAVPLTARVGAMQLYAWMASWLAAGFLHTFCRRRWCCCPTQGAFLTPHDSRFSLQRAIRPCRRLPKLPKSRIALPPCLCCTTDPTPAWLQTGTARNLLQPAALPAAACCHPCTA